MHIGDKLKQRRKELGLSMKEVATAIGVSEATVSRWESGQIANMKRNYVPYYARVLDVSPEFIMGFEDLNDRVHMLQKKRSYNDEYIVTRIPVFSYVSAGSGCFAESNIEEYVDISNELAQSGEFFGVRVKGDSMSPDIKDQDIVIVRKQEYSADGKIVVAVVNGNEGFCKRFVLYDKSIGLVSNNPLYKPMIFSQEEIENLPVRILGVVVELRRTL